MSRTLTLFAPLAGYALALSEVPDPVFAQGLAGDGLAIDPTGETLFAPCAGEVVLMPGGAHALMLRAAGIEIVLHIGIDTVQLQGAGFERLVADGQSVVTGQPLLRFSLDRIARGARSAVTPILLSGAPEVRITRRITGQLLAPGDVLMELDLSAEPARAAAPPAADAVGCSLVAAFAHGIHARPAALIVAALQPLSAQVSLSAHGRRANARSVVALMSLGVRQDEVLQAVAEGPDAQQALAALKALMPSAPAAPVASPARAELAPLTTQQVLTGVSAARGLAVGVAVVLRAEDRDVPESAPDSHAERAALEQALASVKAVLDARRSSADGAAREILEAHVALLSDPELRQRAQAQLAVGRSAAFSYRHASRLLEAQLAGLDDPRLAQRAADLRDLERQVLAVLAGGRADPPVVLPEHAVLIAEEILPSQLLGLAGSRIAGLAMAAGGPTSHVAILAAARGLPALVALGPQLLRVPSGSAVVLDADAGELLVNADGATLAAAQARVSGERARNARDQAQAQAPAITRDGTRIAVLCNLGASAEAPAAVTAGAEGCGLLRTEFLFLERREPPAEEEQAAMYTAVLAGLSGRPLTIRTLDAGGDKPIPYLPLLREDNPALGLRGLRTSLWRPDLFAVQLRAILRAAQRGPCRILLPMVTELAEVQQVRDALDLAHEAVGAGPLPPLGVMVETPACALLAGQLAAHVDFFSIGTNDLAQYTLAMDRQHPALAGRLDGLHPAVLTLIRMTAESAHAQGREAAVCGALASDPLAVPLLLGLGVRELSCAPAMIPRIKALVRSVTLPQCRALSGAALEQASAAQVRALAREWQVRHGLFAEVA